MSLDFDFDSIATTEFGVGRDQEGERTFVYVPTGGDVNEALREMVGDTWDKLTSLTDDPPRYDPSEKYSPEEYTLLPLDDELAATLRTLHEANNLESDTRALDDVDALFCYFVRLVDGRGKRVTGVRRAAQFKGVVKKRLVRVVTDAVRLVDGPVFRLDADFDLLIDGAAVHVLRASGLEFVGQLQAAVMSAAAENVAAMQGELDFVEFGTIEAYATKHPRAARYLASIRTQDGASNIDKRALKRVCRQTGVEFSEVDGKLHVEEPHVLGFLEVLDRRRYELELVRGSPERYRAASRQRLSDASAGQ